VPFDSAQRGQIKKKKKSHLIPFFYEGRTSFFEGSSSCGPTFEAHLLEDTHLKLLAISHLSRKRDPSGGISKPTLPALKETESRAKETGVNAHLKWNHMLGFVV
jgi:hypothetical protein